jgi:hypothetical protein
MPESAESNVKLCQICNQPISEARLEAIPETVLCVNCARKYPPAPIDAAKLDISQASPINSKGFSPKD